MQKLPLIASAFLNVVNAPLKTTSTTAVATIISVIVKPCSRDSLRMASFYEYDDIYVVSV